LGKGPFLGKADANKSLKGFLIMSRKLVFGVVVASLALFRAVPVVAGSVFVSELFSGNVVEVDESGTKTLFTSGLGRPGSLKFDKEGNLFVLDYSEQNSNPRVVKVTPTGETTTFTANLPPISDEQVTRGFGRLAISDEGKVFLLARAFPISSADFPFSEV